MKKILIDYNGDFVRTALVEDGNLVEIIVDDKKKNSIVGNVYVGVVKNILPSKFAFVDIGVGKNAFLNLNDGKEKEHSKTLRQGHDILVQVVNDGSGYKGPHVTSQIHMAGSMAVIFKSPVRSIGVSHKIGIKKQRERLKRIASEILPPSFGVVIRTACENKTDEEIEAALKELLTMHGQTEAAGRHIRGPSVIYSENSILRELLTEDLNEIVINKSSELPAVKSAADRFISGLGDRVSLHTDEIPLFDLYFLESEIEKALEKRVWLKSGGFLVIEQTETCVVIDVNTGKFAGHKNHRETVMRTNLEAVDEIVRQIRLRNLSGIIIIDFIDLGQQEDKQKLTEYFTASLKKDRQKTHITGMTNLGLMTLTRKKTREPLEKIVMCECAACQGRGRVRRPEYMADRS